MVLKRFICYGLVIIWMYTIFLFSSQMADESASLSDGITEYVKVFISDIFDTDMENPDNLEILKICVRKAAHMFMYFVLFMLCYTALSIDITFSKALIISLGICFLYALSDEFHQYFVPGRSAEFRDVFIDTIGAFAACIIVKLSKGIKAYFKKR